ncbi:MAG: BTAD domain-containing putative transcriptional regulator [Leucobacter sp.]
MSAAARLCVLGECRIDPSGAGSSGVEIETAGAEIETAGAELASVDPATVRAPLTGTQRRILARLALDAPASVPVDRIAEAVWASDAPRQFRQAIQNQVSRLRTLWGTGIVTTTPEGYALGCETDAQRLVELTRRAEELLESGEAAAALARVDEALDLCRGTPFADLDHVPAAISARRVLASARHGAENLRVEAALALGRAAWAAVEAERLAESAPFDERRQALRIRALLRTGRRGEAIAAVGAARRRFREDLGVEPGPLLERAEAEALGREAEVAATAGRLPLEGRETELRTVLAELARGSLVRVTGEPGCGISRLLTAVAAQLHTLGVRALAVDAAEHLASAADVLTALIDPECGLTDDGRGIIAGFADAAARMAERGPVAILVDDTDSLGASAHRALAEAAARDRVMVVLGDHEHRRADPAPSPAPADHGGPATVRLAPLDREAVTRIAAAALGRVPSTRDVEGLLAFSGGNPLLLESAFLTGWHAGDTRPGTGGDRDDDSGARGDDDSSDPHGNSGSNSADRARDGACGIARVVRWAADLLTGLGEEQLETLRRAAVAGDGFPSAVVLGDARTAAPPTSLLSTADGGVRFVHGALRDQVLQSIPPAGREELHAALGRTARAAGAGPSLVAHHLLRASELAPTEAVAAAREAAAEASRQGAHADAAEWLARALAVRGMTARDRLGIRIELGDAQRLAGDPAHLEALVTAVSDALDLGDDDLTSAACFALLQLGATSTSGAPLPQIPPLVARALATLMTPEARAPVCAAASLAHSLVGDAERSRDYFAEAVALAARDEDRARVLPFAYMALGAPEELDARAAAAEDLAAIASRIRSAPAAYEAQQLRFSVALQRGEGAAAREAVRHMGELIDEVGAGRCSSRRPRSRTSTATPSGVCGSRRRPRRCSHRCRPPAPPLRTSASSSRSTRRKGRCGSWHRRSRR